jgi:hypothetical protein
MSLDILNELSSVDLSTVQTALPVVAPGVYEVLVAELAFAANKANTGQLLNIKLTLVNPAKSIADDKGVVRDINVGFPIFDRISAVRTFKEDGTTVKYDPLPRFAAFREGVTGDKAGLFMPIEQYIGRKVGIRIAVEDDAEFGTKNVVKKYIKAT